MTFSQLTPIIKVNVELRLIMRKSTVHNSFKKKKNTCDGHINKNA